MRAQARMVQDGRRVRAALFAGSLALAATALPAAPAIAQPAPQAAPEPAPAAARWAQPFAPAIGSRWRIVVETTSTDARGTAPREGRLVQRYDLAYTAREGAGYRVTLVLREASVDGNMPAMQLALSALAPFRDLTVEGITDAAGVPVRVVNETEVRAAASAMGERLVSAFADKPQIAPLMKRALAAVLEPKGAAAATAWLDPLPLLASAQNTALKPGEEQRADGMLPSPFGGTVRSSTVTRLAPGMRPDRFTLRTTETLDPASAREAVLAVVRQFGNAGAPPGGLGQQDMEQALAKVTLEIGQTQEIEVEGGMSRRARSEQTLRGGLAGQVATRTRTYIVTVTPAP